MSRLLTLFLAVAFLSSSAQNLGIGQWQDHLPYSEAINLVEIDNVIFVATKYSLFSFDKESLMVNRISKTNGLSDVGISAMKKSPYSNLIIITYTNGNIDFFENGTIYNIPDIKRKNLVGEKRINDIYFSYKNQETAYLACSFGVVELDINAQEIKNTYHINASQNLSINNLALFNDSLFAATDSGIYSASLKENLSDFRSWTASSFLKNKSISTLTVFDNKLFACKNSDSIYLYGLGNIKIIPNLRGLKVSKNKLFAYAQSHIYEINKNLDTTLLINTSYFYKANDLFLDDEGVFWVADGFRSLSRAVIGGTAASYAPEGPKSNHVFSIFSGEPLIVSTGGIANWNNANITKGVYWSDGLFWGSVSYEELEETRDITMALKDPLNNKIYLSSWNGGLLTLIKNGEHYKLETIFNHVNTNGALQTLELNPSENEYGWVRIRGLAFDDAGNLWLSNSGVDNPLVVKTAEGDWYSFPISSNNSSSYFGNLLIDDVGQIWMITKNEGLVVYFNNGTLENVSDDLDKQLVSSVGSGGLPSNEVYSLAKDKDGEIWVGTNKGVAVFYSPENIFSTNEFDAQQILVDVDGYIELLLENETVTSIAVDEANRKWLGTQSSGVYLFSEDGTKQVHHFTKENSPILSNTILDVKINNESGIVYFGTDLGLISYKSNATKGEENHNNVIVYPNPVKENYMGPIAIKGLVNSASVKITGLNGDLVFSTQAFGGQAVWNGKNDLGERVQTGVYLVFSSDQFGVETNVAKILFIK